MRRLTIPILSKLFGGRERGLQYSHAVSNDEIVGTADEAQEFLAVLRRERAAKRCEVALLILDSLGAVVGYYEEAAAFEDRIASGSPDRAIYYRDFASKIRALADPYNEEYATTVLGG